MIKQISKIIVTFINVFFITLTLGLIFIALFKKEWFELFIEWMKIEIQ
jgi:ABC-type transport system involved in cytochrome c biogenesis permease subunit